MEAYSLGERFSGGATDRLLSVTRVAPSKSLVHHQAIHNIYAYRYTVYIRAGQGAHRVSKISMKKTTRATGGLNEPNPTIKRGRWVPACVYSCELRRHVQSPSLCRVQSCRRDYDAMNLKKHCSGHVDGFITTRWLFQSNRDELMYYR